MRKSGNANGNISDGVAMLQVNMMEERRKVVQHITQSCSALGEVRSIQVVLDPKPIAMIEMSTTEQTKELAQRFGGALIGSAAFINLEPQQV